MDSPLITAHDLRLLSIGYYIQGGISAFYTLMMLGYMAFASALFAGVLKTASASSQQEIPPALISIISLVLAVVLGMACAYTACLFLAGYWLRHTRNMLFLQVLAALNCLAVPYGTVLGIFTFMVLQRSSAKQLFHKTTAPPLAPTSSFSEPPPVTPENPR
jgi:hypothetical protein